MADLSGQPPPSRNRPIDLIGELYQALYGRTYSPVVDDIDLPRLWGAMCVDVAALRERVPRTDRPTPR